MEKILAISILVLLVPAVVLLAYLTTRVYIFFKGMISPHKEISISPEELEENRRQEWIMQHGTTEEKILLQLEIQNRLLRQNNEQARLIGKSVAMGNMFDTFDH